MLNPVFNDMGRMWLAPNGLRGCCSELVFTPCITIDAISASIGDLTEYYCPSATAFRKFDVIGVIQGEKSRFTATLNAHYTRDERSAFLPLFNQGCSFDLQIHIGGCDNPSVYDGPNHKVIILTDVYVQSFNLDPLIAMEQGDRTIVNESGDISFEDIIEVLPLKWRTVIPIGASGSVVGLTVVDNVRCGGVCGDGSNGCQNVWGVTNNGDIVYSDDANMSSASFATIWAGGQTILDKTTNAQLAVSAPECGIVYNSQQLWYVGTDGNIVHQYPSLLQAGTDVMLTTLSSENVPAHPVYYDANDNFGIVGGADGVIYTVFNPANGSALDTVGFANPWRVVKTNYATNDTLLGGDNGQLAWTNDGYSFIAPESTPASVLGADVTAVWAHSNDLWYIGTSIGELWCTDDCGNTWTEVVTPICEQIDEIGMVNDHVGYLLSDNVMYRTYNGGKSWRQQPETSSSKNVAVTGLNMKGFESCKDDVNSVWVHGTNTAGEPVVYIGSDNF